MANTKQVMTVDFFTDRNVYVESDITYPIEVQERDKHGGVKRFSIEFIRIEEDADENETEIRGCQEFEVIDEQYEITELISDEYLDSERYYGNYPHHFEHHTVWGPDVMFSTLNLTAEEHRAMLINAGEHIEE